MINGKARHLQKDVQLQKRSTIQWPSCGRLPSVALWFWGWQSRWISCTSLEPGTLPLEDAQMDTVSTDQVARGHPSLLLSTAKTQNFSASLQQSQIQDTLAKKGNTCWKLRGAMELRLQIALPHVILSKARLMSSFISKGTFCFHISSSFSSTLPWLSSPYWLWVFLLKQSVPTCAVSKL